MQVYELIRALTRYPANAEVAVNVMHSSGNETDATIDRIVALRLLTGDVQIVANDAS